MVISGKKTMLLPMDKNDRKYLELLLAKADRMSVGVTPIVNDSFAWRVMTKEGKATRTVGIICLSPTGDTGAAILNAFIEPEFAKDIEAKMVKNYTYVEDAIKTISDEAIKTGFVRIETFIGRIETVNISLLIRIGFMMEGVLRKAFRTEKGYTDLAVMSIIKEN